VAAGADLPDDLRRALRGVRSVGVITGAGVSRESGIPTYRGEGGIYDDPEEGDRTVEALSGPTLRAHPDRTWRVVADLARRSREARPSAAHEALAELERRVERFVLLTQNVDGLHRAAGSRNVIEIHGDVLATLCTACGVEGRLDAETLRGLDGAPACAACGGGLRPDVVLFGEWLPREKVERLRREFYVDPPDLVLVAGTSALFPYVVEPVVLASRLGRLTIEVNPEETPLSGVVGHALRGTAGEWIPRIVASTGGL
jgi:NAD-dependent deacetylase